MKRILSILLCAVMLIGVLAAAPFSASAKTYVTTAKQKTYYSDGMKATYRIPKLDLPGTADTAFNKAVTKKYSQFFTYANQNSAKNYPLDPKGINYTTYTNGSILSIVITLESLNNQYIEYDVYNYNVKTGKKLTNSDILKAKGVSATAAKKNVIALLRSEFNKATVPSSMQDLIKKHTNMSIADKNMKDNLYYLGKNGKLMAKYRIYWIAGSGCYYRLAALSAYAATPQASAKNTKSGIYLSWKKVAGAAKYRVFIKTSSGWTKLGDTAKTAYVYKKAKSGKRYTFTLRALDKQGNFISSYNKTGKTILCKR